MNNVSTIDALKNKGQIWAGDDWRLARIQSSPSGYTDLDSHLPGGGWPLGAVTELLTQYHGMGELRLLAPYLAKLGRQDQRWQVWINPPYQPHGPGLRHWHLNIEKILVCKASKQADLLWSIEQSMVTGGASVVLAWIDIALDKAQLRRMQLAAEKNNIPVFLLRPAKFKNAASIAALRLFVSANNEQKALRVDILKRKAGWPLEDLQLPVPLFNPKGALHEA